MWTRFSKRALSMSLLLPTLILTLIGCVRQFTGESNSGRSDPIPYSRVGISLNEARQQARQLLDDPAMPSDAHSGGVSSPTPGFYRFSVAGRSGEDEAPRVSGFIRVRILDGTVTFVRLEVRSSSEAYDGLSEEAASQVARSFLLRQFPEIADGSDLEMRTLAEPKDGSDHLWRFYFVKRDGGFLTPHTSDVYVDAQAGHVVLYSRRDAAYEIPATCITRDAALDAAQKALKRSDDAAGYEWRLEEADRAFYSRGSNSREIPTWSVRFVPQQVAGTAPGDGCGFSAHVYIHATSGETIAVDVL